MGVVHEPVEDGVGEAPCAEVLVPVADRQLGSGEGCAAAVALLECFEQVLFFALVERSKAGRRRYWTVWPWRQACWPRAWAR